MKGCKQEACFFVVARRLNNHFKGAKDNRLMSCLAINDVQHRTCNSCLFNVMSFGGPAKKTATVDLLLREEGLVNA
eukprot:6318738-Amphidinium_carterae.1